jgi:hypothetical protein
MAERNKGGGRPHNPSGPRRRASKVYRDAVDEAVALGPIIEVEPGRGYLADGAPQAGPGQSYVSKYGAAYHSMWCEHVGHLWDENPKRLFVIEDGTQGKRQPCGTCAAV